MGGTFEITSPHTGLICRTLKYTSKAELDDILDRAKNSQENWASRPASDRVELLRACVKQVGKHRDRLAQELTALIGRPINNTGSDIDGFVYRANCLLDMAEEQLVDTVVHEGAQEKLFVRKEPLGIVYCIGAWNYPYLVVVNTLIPALAAGNSVVLKHAPQTGPVGDSLREVFEEAGLPSNLLSSIHLKNDDAEKLIHDSRISFVSLVGSVRAGHAVQHAASKRSNDFIGVSLELGGCDAAYVRQDVDLNTIVPELVRGVFANGGQCCCGVQRILVARSIYDLFVETFKREMHQQLYIGDPTSTNVTLGPMVSHDAAKTIRKQLSKLDKYPHYSLPLPDGVNDAYVAPTIYFDPPRDSPLMKEEVFGPAAAIVPVDSDEEAIKLINNTIYGLTASIWTKDAKFVEGVLPNLEVGTVYLNRCDCIHPKLPWSGRKASGLGFTLSKYAYSQVTALKAVNMKYC